MASAERWGWWPLPAWLGSGAAWFVFLNVVVGAIALLSSRARPPSSPRLGGISRRASSAVLQRLRSFSIFSFPSACFHTTPLVQPFPSPDTATAFREREEPGTARKQPSRPRALAPPAAAEPTPEAEEEDPNSMSLEEAYAMALAGRQRPAQTEEEVSRSEVDAKDDLRQQRLNSIFNYTQMLKNRALAAGRRPPVAGPDTSH